MSGRPWDAHDDRWLRRLWGEYAAWEIADLLDRTALAVYQRARKLGLPRKTAPHPPEVIEAIRRLHGQGLNDAEIAAQIPGVDRRTIADIRNHRLGLPVNGAAVLRARRRGVETQRRVLGIRHGGDLRRLGFRRFAESRGWPADLRPRAVQILELLAVAARPMDRWEIAERIGWNVGRALRSKYGQRTLLCSNDPEGSYLAHLMKRGLVACLGRVRQYGRRRGQTRCLYTLTPAAIDTIIRRASSGQEPRRQAQ